MPMEKEVYQERDGVRRTVYFDRDEPDDFVIQTEQDISPLLDTVKEMAEVHPKRSTNKLVARVPVEVYERSVHERWDDDDWKKWLNDPDNSPFRVWKGKV